MAGCNDLRKCFCLELSGYYAGRNIREPELAALYPTIAAQVILTIFVSNVAYVSC